MKSQTLFILILFLLLTGCTSQKELAYLNNLAETGGEATFTMEIPNYLIQPRDILYITIKAMTPEGLIIDFLMDARSNSGGVQVQGDAGGYLYGYDVNSNGEISLPAVGNISVGGLTLEEIKKKLQAEADKVFKNSTVDCKLLSFKFTVIGEVKAPGTYINYSNYLTIFEAIGRAGGVGDYGKRNKVLVIRPYDKGTKTFSIDLQDKKLLNSEAYFLLPNDVIIVEPLPQKTFNLNLPTLTFFVTTTLAAITSTLLLINYFGQ